MFSANENILLRQHKKRVVEYVESTIPETVLDVGVNVMAMQVSCVTPGCVPIETAIIIIFPKLNNNAKELLPGLPESGIGGSYKTKILKPLMEVTKEDVLDALPPSFLGGTKSIEKLCYQIRDNLLAQITQLFDDNAITVEENNRNTAGTATSTSGAPVVVGQQQRHLVAQYIQECLQQYIDHDCTPPEIGQPYPDSNNSISINDNTGILQVETTSLPQTQEEPPPQFAIPSAGNITIPRPMDDDATTFSVNSIDNKNTSPALSTNEVGTDPPPRF